MVCSVALSLIVAVSTNGVIGQGNRLPWRLPDELAHFHATTQGGVVIMGRRTYTSIGRALPGRLNIVLSREPGFQPADASVASSFDRAIEIAQEQASTREIFVVGGASIYALALPLVKRLYFTRVHQNVAGDVYFPDYDWEPHFEIEQEQYFSHEAIPYTIFVATRRSSIASSPR